MRYLTMFIYLVMIIQSLQPLHLNIRNGIKAVLKYLSIDVETTGLNRSKCQVIELAVVAEDVTKSIVDLPWIRLLIRHPFYYIEDPMICRLHTQLFKELEERPLTGDWDSVLMTTKIDWHIDKACVHLALMRWGKATFGPDYVWGETKSVVGGKNYTGFDHEFLIRLNASPNAHQRVVDPGPMWLEATDDVPPNLQTCLDRAQAPRNVEHKALNDCFDVIYATRRALGVPYEGLSVE